MIFFGVIRTWGFIAVVSIAPSQEECQAKLLFAFRLLLLL